VLEASMAAGLILQPSRRVSTAWRAASIGLMTAVVILGAAFIDVYNTNVKTREVHQNNLVLTDVLRTMGGPYMDDSLFDRGTQRIVFEDDGATGGQASIFTNPDWENSRFFCKSLPSLNGQTYRIVLVDEKNQVIEEIIEPFVSDGALMTIDLPVIASGSRVAIVAADLGQPAGAGSKVLMLARVV